MAALHEGDLRHRGGGCPPRPAVRHRQQARPRPPTDPDQADRPSPARQGGRGGSEEHLRRAAAVLDSYRGQLEALSRQSEVVRVSLDEYRRARETVVRYREAGAGKEVLLPVGGGSFVRATSTDPEKVLTSIGSALVIEDSAENTAKRLEARNESLEKAAS